MALAVNLLQGQIARSALPGDDSLAQHLEGELAAFRQEAKQGMDLADTGA